MNTNQSCIGFQAEAFLASPSEWCNFTIKLRYNFQMLIFYLLQVLEVKGKYKLYWEKL